MGRKIKLNRCYVSSLLTNKVSDMFIHSQLNLTFTPNKIQIMYGAFDKITHVLDAAALDSELVRALYA